MIYNKGTISVAAGSPTVTGVGSMWNKKVAAGDVLYVDGSSTAYYVAAVVSDTELKLTEGYVGASQNDLGYVIVSDFSYQYSIPFPKHMDVEKASVTQRSARLVDRLLHQFDVRVLNIEYPAGVVLDMTSTPSIDTIFVPGTDQQISLSGYGIPSQEAFGILTIGTTTELITADSDYVTADSNTATADGSWGGAQPTDYLYPTGIPSEEAFGTPLVENTAVQAIYPTGIPSAEAVGTPLMTVPPITADNNNVTADSSSVTADGHFSPYILTSNDEIKASDGTITADQLYI